MTQPPFDPQDLPRIEEVPIPDSLPILSLPDAVIFPGAVVALSISGDAWVNVIDDAALSNRVIGVFWDTAGELNSDPRTLANTGCAAQIARLTRQPGGGVQVLLQGLARIQIRRILSSDRYLKAEITVLPEPESAAPEVEALARTVRVAFEQVVRLSPNLPDQAAVVAANIPRPGILADLIAANLDIAPVEQQSVLESIDLPARLGLVLGFLERERELLDIANRTREDVAKNQREYVLRQQLETIKRELGEDDEQGAEVAELRRRLEEANLPEEPRREAERELDRLARMHPAAPDFSITRTYLDWILGLPWNTSTPDKLDLERARRVLDEDHYDLERIKERIVEYLAVRKLQAEHAERAPQMSRRSNSPILCFVGPPGVGKTSLGQSVARALERKFVRVALGGVRDESDIRGFRRTYIGAIPGRIMQGLSRGGSNNPVMLLDEIDKLAAGIQGDPSAALLELLDPAQNHTFVDRYLDVPFDMSKVLFICTANQLETIPGPLIDRMELINLAGYTELEKMQIARRYLIPRQIEANGLAPLSEEHGTEQVLPTSDNSPGTAAEGAGAPVAASDMPASNLPPQDVAERSLAPELADSAVQRLIREYTMEAGVRDLERRIGAIFRKMATRLADQKPLPEQVEGADLDELLGPPRFRSERILGEDEVGVVTGLAWTPAGGDVLMVEASAVPGSGQLILTGHLGDVMRESARAAVTYARSRDGALGIPADEFQKRDIHIHVPAGAVPKDGPSAGITMASAIISALTGRIADKRVAMTGEITLRGKVLPIGGLKEKLLAAQRAGVRTVLIPRDNEIDLRDVPQETRDQLEIIAVDHMDDVVPVALHELVEQSTP